MIRHHHAAARRAYRLRRLAIAFIAITPVWSIYCYAKTDSISMTLFATFILALPTALLVYVLFTVADVELANSRVSIERRK